MNIRKILKCIVKKANGFVKEPKPEEAVKFYKKAEKSLENLIKFDENKYNHPAYQQKKTEIEKKIEEIE